MAEETEVIANINISVDAAIKGAASLKDEVQELKDRLKEAKNSTGAYSKETVQAEAALRAAQKELREQNRLIDNVTKSQKENIGSLEKWQAENAVMRKEQKGLNLETDEGKKRNEELTKAINLNTKSIKENSDKFVQDKINVGNYKDELINAKGAVEGMSPAFDNAAAAGEGFRNTLKALAKNPWAIALGAIIGLFATLQKAFKRSEENGNKLSVAFGKLSGVFNKVMDGLEPVVNFIVDKVIATFEKLGEVANTVLGWVSDGLEALGFEEAAKGIDTFVEKIEEASKAGGELADMQSKLNAAQRESEKIQLDYQKAAEKQRQIRDDESKSIAERIAANEKLGATLKEQANEELRIAQQALDLANKRIEVKGDTTENLDAQAEALVKISEIQERITGQESEQLTNRIALQKEGAEKAIANMEAELEYWKLSNREKLKSSTDLDNELLAKQQEILEKQKQNRLISEQEYQTEYLALKVELAEKEAELQSQIDEQKKIDDEKADELKKEADAINAENDLALKQQQLEAILGAEAAALQISKEQEIKKAEEVGADVKKINEKYAKAEKAIEKSKQDAKLALAAGFANNIATIFGEQTAVGKAAAVAATTISTYQSAVSAFASMASIPVVGPALGAVAAGAAVASGLATVKKILAVKTDVKSGSSSPSGGGASYTSVSSVPSASTQSAEPVDLSSSNIAGGIVSRDTDTGSQTQGTQVAVVVDDVTAAQDVQIENNSLSTI